MLTDVQLDRYAEVLLWGLKTARKGRFRKHDIVLVQYDPAAVRLAEILHAKILARGMNPVQRAGLTVKMERGFYTYGGARQLTFLAPGDRELYENIHGRIFLRAPDSVTHLKDVDPARIGKVLVSRKPLRDILDRREERGQYGWTLCILPTAELARQARTTLKAYEAQLIRACYLDREDPVAEWERIFRDMREIKRWLNALSVKAFHVEGQNIDLTVTPGGQRKWAGVSGHNIPSFEVFLSPDWRGTEGTYYANQPSFRSGNYVEGVRLTFRRGSVVKSEAATGGAFVKKQLAIDRGAGRLGEFSLTDRRFSRIDRFMAETLFDENHGGRYGNCHIAVGASYSDTYRGDPAALTQEKKAELGFNDSALHWDLVNTEDKTVTAHLTTGEKVVIYANGCFLNG